MRPFGPVQQRPFPPVRPAPARHTPYDAANDPRWDDPLQRQVEVDKLKPEYVRPEPGKPRPDVDPFSHIPPDVRDPRWGRLTEVVGDPPWSNVYAWKGLVNPDIGKSKHYQMNCAEVSRNTAAILNGDRPRLAAGNTFKSGEYPEGTLEWMGLADFKPEHKLAAPNGPHNPAEFTDRAYRTLCDALRDEPPGTHANVFVTWRSGMPGIPGGGHVFNAFVDERRKVKFLDAQPRDGKLVDAFPDGSTDPRPNNPYRDLRSGDPIDITSMQFAIRQRGGPWQGVPRTPGTPPASQLQYPRAQTPVGDQPHVPEPNVPEPRTPDTDRPEQSDFDSLTELVPPSARTPEADSSSNPRDELTQVAPPSPRPPATGGPAGHADAVPDPQRPPAPETHRPPAQQPQRTPETHRPPAPETQRAPAPEPQRPPAQQPPRTPSPSAPPRVPVAPSELADRAFRASPGDEEAFRSDPLSRNSLIGDQRQRARDLGTPVEELSDGEVTAMHQMLGMPHQDVNQRFRAGDASVEREPLVRLATSGLNKLPDYEGEVHRGLVFDTDAELEAFLNRYQRGAAVREPAFQHSAKDEDEVTRGTKHSHTVVVHIDARHGKDLAFLRRSDEDIQEVVHPPHTVFYPSETYYDDNAWHVKVRDYSEPVQETGGSEQRSGSVG